MKNKLLFMMLTILGAPGIAAAAGYDLANSEYNFAGKRQRSTVLTLIYW